MKFSVVVRIEVNEASTDVDPKAKVEQFATAHCEESDRGMIAVGAGARRSDRSVGLTEHLPAEWIEAVRFAEVPPEFAHLDHDLT